MSNEQNSKPYDLEDRTLEFARRIREFVKRLPKTIGNIEDGKQLIRSSGSIGANYIEANEALSKKDFLMRIKISRKEAKETRFWLRLVDVGADQALILTRDDLLKEVLELLKICSSIVAKSV